MHELPDSFDANIFVGQMLEQVSFSVNTIHFAFEGDLSITVVGSVSHERPSSVNGAETSTIPVVESRLMSLLGRTVEAAKVESKTTVALAFDDDQVLRCLGDSDAYECYRISTGTAEIIV